MNLAVAGYAKVTAAEARPGDTVVRGGHAGIYVGMIDGKVIGYANNGSPATPEQPNVDRSTGNYNFSATKAASPEFFRPVVPCP